MKKSVANPENNDKKTSRLETFSDGVFAIAITLLILELINVLHQQSSEGLLRLLANHWQSFVAFIIGFLTILVCWINHHLVFVYINKTDSNLMWVNGFVLLVVTFTPFPTAVLAEYFEKDSHTALAFFGFNYFLMSVAAYFICAYPYKKHLIEEGSRELFRYFKLLYSYSIIYTVIIFFLCFISASVAIFLYFLLFIVFAFPKEVSKKLFMKNKKTVRHK